jgi:site-specific DNA recombinase
MSTRRGRPKRGAASAAGSLPERVRAAGYLRVSTAEQAAEGFGLEAQESAIRAYCLAQGWELVDLYVDAGVSGAKADRPELGRLLVDAEAGRFQRVVILKLDRLARSVKDLLALYDRLEQVGVAVASVRESLDTSTHYGRLFRNILASLAEFERDAIAERVQGGRVEKARRGGSLGGFVPYGYTRAASGALAVDPTTVAVVRRIFAERLAGRTLAEIATDLNADRVATARAGRWVPSTVHGILTNPVYMGRPGWDKRGSPIVAERATVPEMVSEATFRGCQGAGSQAA